MCPRTRNVARCPGPGLSGCGKAQAARFPPVLSFSETSDGKDCWGPFGHTVPPETNHTRGKPNPEGSAYAPSIRAGILRLARYAGHRERRRAGSEIRVHHEIELPRPGNRRGATQSSVGASVDHSAAPRVPLE